MTDNNNNNDGNTITNNKKTTHLINAGNLPRNGDKHH